MLRFVLALIASIGGTVYAEDWLRFRGPNLNGVSTERLDLSKRDTSTPKTLWTADVQTGVSGVVVSNLRAYTIGNSDDQDTVFCFDVTTGKIIWQHRYSSATDPNEFEGGPTSTPTVDDDQLFSLSREGLVHCFDKTNGDLVWQTHVPDETGIRIPGWGFAGSPWVQGNLVLLNIGDAGVALEKHTGNVAWQSADKDAGYSSFVPIDVGRDSAVVFGSARSYVCVRIKDGHELWRQRWLTTFGCNAADPIVFGEHVFLSSGYNRGSALLKPDGDGINMVWKHKDFQNQISTSVLINRHVYGIHGDVDAGAQLRCIDPKSGEVKWSDDSFHPTAISAAQDHLIIVCDDGDLVIGKAQSTGFDTRLKHNVLSGKCWTAPVLSSGRLLVRSVDGELVCLEMPVKTE